MKIVSISISLILVGFISFQAKAKSVLYTCLVSSQKSPTYDVYVTIAPDNKIAGLASISYSVDQTGTATMVPENQLKFNFTDNSIQTTAKNSILIQLSPTATLTQWINYDASTYNQKTVTAPVAGYLKLTQVLKKQLSGMAVIPFINNGQEAPVTCDVQKFSDSNGNNCGLFFCL